MDSFAINELFDYVNADFMQALVKLLIIVAIISIIAILFTETIKLIYINLSKKKDGLNNKGKKMPRLLCIIVDISIVILSSIILVGIFNPDNVILNKIYNILFFVIFGTPLSILGYNLLVKPVFNYILAWENSAEVTRIEEETKKLKAQQLLMITKLEITNKIKEIELGK